MNKDILKLAWPVLIGQLAVMANGVIDTVMAGRLSAADVAAVGLGSSIYVSIYIGLMGVLLALSPVAAQHYGAGRFEEIGADVRQALWLALLLMIPGCTALGFTDLWLAFAQPPAEVATIVRHYLLAAAVGLPAALLFRVFYALSNAIARPKAVMVINLAGLALKIPLNLLFMHGWQLGEHTLLPALGGAGCGVATAIVMWLSALLSGLIAWRRPLYRRFHIGGLGRPEPTRLRQLLRLGLPIGASFMVEVTSFTFMAVFLARLGATVAASHQIAANLAAVCYMLPLALANATSVLVAQSLGAAQHDRARLYAIHGLRLALGCALVVGATLFLARERVIGWYSTDAAVIATAVSLVAIVALFHLFDAVQAMISFILRAHKITTLPMIVYLVSLWGVGLAGGWWLSFVVGRSGSAWAPYVAAAKGFWIAATLSLGLASVWLAAILVRVWRRQASGAAGS
ncbi:MAG: MATE family efflux transporter [Burkholderiales bacterium]|nr:MATE family efflux transporter [Burkholderiales bacterium]